MKPLISCVIPVFNDRDRLPGAVASALRQMQDVQVIVVDDGSDGGSADVAQNLTQSDSRIVAIDQALCRSAVVPTMPRISCIIPVLNNRDRLPRTTGKRDPRLGT